MGDQIIRLDYHASICKASTWFCKVVLKIYILLCITQFYALTKWVSSNDHFISHLYKNISTQLLCFSKNGRKKSGFSTTNLANYCHK